MDNYQIIQKLVDTYTFEDFLYLLEDLDVLEELLLMMPEVYDEEEEPDS